MRLEQVSPLLAGKDRAVMLCSEGLFLEQRLRVPGELGSSGRVASGTQWVLPECSMGASPVPVPAPGQLGLGVQGEREGPRVPPGARPGEGRGWVSRPAGSHLRCPSLCGRPPTSPSRVPGTRDPRRTHAHTSPARLRTHHCPPTSARPARSPAARRSGSRSAARALRPSYSGNYSGAALGAWPLPGHLLGSGKRTSP